MSRPLDPDDLSRHVTGLRCLARRLIGDEHRAEDVVQEALFVATCPPDGRAPRSPVRWLYSVVRNLALRERRDDDTRRRYERRAPGPSTPSDPAGVAARAELHTNLVHALLALDEPYRTTLLRRFFDGLSAAEIAREQGIPAATVRTRTRRGLARLRERLDDRHHGRAAWMLLFAPLARGPAPASTASPASSSAATSTLHAVHPVTGAALMTTKKLVAVVAATLLLATVVWWSGGDLDRESDAARKSDVALVSENVPAEERTPLDRRIARLPEPVDLSAVDPELDLHGRVSDEQGAPVAGARIEVVRMPWRRKVLNVDDRNEHVPVAEAITALDGSFRVRLRRGDRVALRASHLDYATTEIPSCLAGQRLDVTLTPGVSLIVDVLGPDDEPVSGASVRLDRPPDQRPGRPGVDATGRTDARGRCVLRGLPPREYGRLMVDHELGSTWRSRVTLPRTGESVVELRLPAGRAVSGVVRDAETGAPVESAVVSTMWTFPRQLHADADGSFVIPNVTSSTYSLYARADGYAEGGVSLSTETEVVIELERAASLGGRLLGPEGRPVQGARIAVIADGSESVARAKCHGESDVEGRFRITGLQSGVPHVMIVLADGLVRHLTDLDAPPSPGALVELGDLVLPRGRRVAGRVVTDEGEPLAHTVVKLGGANADRSRLRESGGAVASSYGTEETCWTDDRGRFQFTDVAPGSYDVTANAAGRKTATLGIDVGGDHVDDVVVRVLGGHRLRVHVEDDRGEPVPWVQVTARTADAWSISATTGTDGVVDFDSDAPITSVRAFSWAIGGPRVSPPPEQAVPEEAAEVRIELRRGGIASGRVVGPDGRCIVAGRFRVLVDGEEVRQGSPFEAYGHHRATGEFEAIVPLGARATVELVEAAQVDPATGTPIRLDGRIEGVEAGDSGLVLRARARPRDRSLEAVVLDPDGMPIPGASVSFRMSGAPERTSDETTGRTGRAFFEGLQSTRYWFDAELPVGHPGRKEWVAPNLPVEVTQHRVVLQFSHGVSVGGRIVGDGSRPLGGASVLIFAPETRQVVRAVTDDDGRFALALPLDMPRPLGMSVHHRDERGVVRTYRDPDFRPATGLELHARAR